MKTLLRHLGTLVFCIAALLSSQSQTRSVKGRVLAENGDPVKEAEVYFETMEEPKPSRRPTVKTDERGAFELNVIPGTYAIHAFKNDAGYPDLFFAFSLAPNAEVRMIKIGPDEDLTGIDVRLGPKPAVLHFRVLDARTDQVLGGAEYRLCQVRRPTYCIDASAPGEYDFFAPATEISIEVSAKGHTKTKHEEHGNAFITVKPGEERNLVVRLMPQ